MTDWGEKGTVMTDFQTYSEKYTASDKKITKKILTFDDKSANIHSTIDCIYYRDSLKEIEIPHNTYYAVFFYEFFPIYMGWPCQKNFLHKQLNTGFLYGNVLL